MGSRIKTREEEKDELARISPDGLLPIDVAGWHHIIGLRNPCFGYTVAWNRI
jgi:hypothetical protein